MTILTLNGASVIMWKNIWIWLIMLDFEKKKYPVHF